MTFCYASDMKQIAEDIGDWTPNRKSVITDINGKHWSNALLTLRQRMELDMMHSKLMNFLILLKHNFLQALRSHCLN